MREDGWRNGWRDGWSDGRRRMDGVMDEGG